MSAVLPVGQGRRIAAVLKDLGSASARPRYTNSVFTEAPSPRMHSLWQTFSLIIARNQRSSAIHLVGGRT